MLILDEADRLYSLGQAETVKNIISFLPKQRRTGLFSATLADSSEMLMQVGMRNPVSISLSPTVSQNSKIPSGLSIYYSKVAAAEKTSLLLSFLKSHPNEKHIIFFSTCAAVEYFSAVLKYLLGENSNILWIHGKIDKPTRRAKIFRRFQTFSNAILITTDLMSRGVDFPDVDWVVQFEPPSNPATFVHRCGRTARLDKIGSALVLLLPNEIEYVRFIDKNQGIQMRKFDYADLPLETEKILALMRKACLDDR